MPYNTARKYYEGIQTRKDVYLYIIRYLREHDYPPSIPEIAAGLSISNHTVQNHFGELNYWKAAYLRRTTPVRHERIEWQDTSSER